MNEPFDKALDKSFVLDVLEPKVVVDRSVDEFVDGVLTIEPASVPNVEAEG